VTPVTEWYDGTQTPVRVGSYERRVPDYNHDIINLYWWDGHYWRFGPGRNVSLWQSVSWRGLTAPYEGDAS
jgi:hypothetical protein